jgi:putative transposase
VAASTVWEILKEAGIDPAPERACSTWADFLRSQADALLACDFFETVTLTGTRMYVFAVIEHASRRIRILGVTPHPTASWVMQAAKNLVMDLEDTGCRARFLIRDRDGKFPKLFDAVLSDAGIQVVLNGIRMPRMNSVMERWVQTCRRELLDRTLTWNQRHLLHALREFEQFYNGHRHTRASRTPARCTRCPRRSQTRTSWPVSTSEDAIASAAYSTSTNTPRDLRGRGYRQGQHQHTVIDPQVVRQTCGMPTSGRLGR